MSQKIKTVILEYPAIKLFANLLILTKTAGNYSCFLIITISRKNGLVSFNAYDDPPSKKILKEVICLHMRYIHICNYRHFLALRDTIWFNGWLTSDKVHKPCKFTGTSEDYMVVPKNSIGMSERLKLVE